MSEIQRYKMIKAPSGSWFSAGEHEHGKWVKYTDYVKAIEDKDKEIKLRNDWIKKRDEYALSLLQRIEADSIEIQRLKNEVCDE